MWTNFYSVKELTMQLLEQNIKLKMTKVKDFVYQIVLPAPYSESRYYNAS